MCIAITCLSLSGVFGLGLDLTEKHEDFHALRLRGIVNLDLWDTRYMHEIDTSV